jgi:hypothetical protein
MKGGLKYPPCFEFDIFVLLICNLKYVTMLLRASQQAGVPPALVFMHTPGN